MAKAKTLIGRLVWEPHTVGERVPGGHAGRVVSQDDVGEFVRKYHGQAGFIGKHIHQTPTYHDRVPDAERLKWSSKQKPRTHWGQQLKVVGDDQIVDHG